ncbi:MAG: hypothetical protein HY242_09115 [Afipia sp.]|nr:hypothetical protein [Afipia sp.]
MSVVPFPEKQAPYFADLKAVIDFAQSMHNVAILDENHRLALIALLMEHGDADSAEVLQATANLMGQND